MTPADYALAVIGAFALSGICAAVLSLMFGDRHPFDEDMAPPQIGSDRRDAGAHN